MVDIPGDTTTQAVLDTNDAEAGTFSGQLEFAGDQDFIKVTLEQNVTYLFYVSFLDTGSLTDGNATLSIRDAAGNEQLTDNNGGSGLNAFLFFLAPSNGTFFLDIGESGDNNTGEYSLVSTINSGSTDIEQTDGNDIYTSTVADERILGGTGADTLTLSATGLDILGEQGNDILTGNTAPNKLFGGLGNDSMFGLGGDDDMFGESGNDDMFGGPDGDSLRGGAGGDHLFGEAGDDDMIGGAGKDFMTGGADQDIFAFEAKSDSPRGANRDVILDFSNLMGGDTIRLTSIDAKAGVDDNQAFKFIGQQPFHDKKGELRFKINAANDLTVIQGDINGDGRADVEIQLSGQITLFAFNFDL
jgi:Ca2+-binding RTX toxin-like protein